MNRPFRMKSSPLALALGLLTAATLVAGPAMQLKPMNGGAAPQAGAAAGGGMPARIGGMPPASAP